MILFEFDLHFLIVITVNVEKKKFKLRHKNVRLQKHWKCVIREQIEKSGMADHRWTENGSHVPLWKEVKNYRQRRIEDKKTSMHMLGGNSLISRSNIELNTIW